MAPFTPRVDGASSFTAMIFISRSLSADSPLRAWASQQGYSLHEQSLISFAAVPFAAPASADWWFYYSSRAVRFAGVPPGGVRLAALGDRTAAALRERAGRVDFCGVGQPEQVARQFAEVAGGQRVFFPRARASRRSVQHALRDRITALDAVCYDNRPAPPAAPIEARVYIFTSPLNVAAYLAHFPLAVDAGVLAMGPSTAAALTARGIPCTHPDQPTEAALLPLVSRIISG